ncbi:MAG: peptide deformylase [Chitinophagales bacterium]
MILPIIAYGDPVLKKEAKAIDDDYSNLQTLLANMYETMYNASGVGLAAPQIGLSIRLFIVDSEQVFEDMDEEESKGEVGIKKVFINPEIVETSGKEWTYTEGCLSIPDIREDVKRQETVVINYLDENFEEHEETYNGITARVILHEYDHIDGILFTDYLGPVKKRLLKKRLERITKGTVDVEYRMKFPKQRKGRK